MTKFYCALSETDAIAWQDGEQTVNPETGEITPIGFIPTFVCEWDGVSSYYTPVFGVLGTVPESMIEGVNGEIITIPAHDRVIPFAGWPPFNGDEIV